MGNYLNGEDGKIIEKTQSQIMREAPNSPEFYINTKLIDKSQTAAQIISKFLNTNGFTNNNLLSQTIENKEEKKENQMTIDINNSKKPGDSENNSSVISVDEIEKKKSPQSLPVSSNVAKAKIKNKSKFELNCDNSNNIMKEMIIEDLNSPEDSGSILMSPKINLTITKKNLKTVPSSLQKDIRKVYKFRNELGGGHFGTVREGYRRHEVPRKYYAIKSRSKRDLSQKDLEDLIKEVDLLSGLDHPNIIKFYETYHDEFYFHIVMELARGKEVFDMIVEDGYVKEDKVVKVIMKVLHAISYCHSRGVTHRDLKPENILFASLEPDSEIKLIDFGLSRKYFTNQKMHTILGTPYYVAPEVLQGEYDEKCDMWSIGALCYIMLCGEPPFQGNSNNEIFNKIISEEFKFNNQKWKKVSKNAKNFVTLCLNKNSQRRPSAIQALNHPWFSEILKEIHSPNNIRSDILNNLKQYSCPQRFKKMVYRFLVNQLSSKELKIYKNAFYAMDLNHLGSINAEELEKSYKIGNVDITKEEINQILLISDESGKGSIDYTEFLIACTDKKELLTKEKLATAFQYFDVNNSGFIEVSDLKDAMLRFGKKIIHSKDVMQIMNEVIEKSKTISLDQFLHIFGIES